MVCINRTITNCARSPTEFRVLLKSSINPINQKLERRKSKNAIAYHQVRTTNRFNFISPSSSTVHPRDWNYYSGGQRLSGNLLKIILQLKHQLNQRNLLN
jgi:hypothetical protein